MLPLEFFAAHLQKTRTKTPAAIPHKKQLAIRTARIFPPSAVLFMISRQWKNNRFLETWLEKKPAKLNIVGSYSLLYNASLFVQEGFASAICIDGIVNTKGTNMVFRPTEKQPDTKISIIWKKSQVMTKAAEAFLAELRG